MAEYVGALKDISALDLGAIAARAALARTGVARSDRPRRVRQRAADERRCDLRRAPRRPQGRRAGGGAGADGQSPLRVWHPGRHQRRADDPAGRGRHRADRRHGEHEPGAARDPRAARRAAPRAGQARRLAVGGAHRHALRLQHGGDRRELRREVRHLAAGAGRVRAAQPAARGGRVGRGAFRGRGRARGGEDAQGRRRLRARRPHAAGHHARRPGEAAGGVLEEWLRHRRQRQRHRRRRRRAGARVAARRSSGSGDAARPARGVGDDGRRPDADGMGPAPATRKLLERTGPDARPTSTCSRSTRRSPRSTWRSNRSSGCLARRST